MKRIRVYVACLAFAACSSDSTGPESVDLTGTWSISDNGSNAAIQVSCAASGTMIIQQTGSTFSGTYTAQGSCNGPGGSADGSGAGTITGGQINGSSVSFTDDGGCTYNGTMSGNPVNRIAGNEVCVIGIQGQNYTFTGTWIASR